ncbi:bifunctional cytochrome P450/NADPH--P450 reductase [Piscicoccus intestinalis]|uniref:bifunctional cytochrome P450/NADPH--P450 reductase n=1 Tax=Piscicoccus intestinalis TaxID=746033 RepID=UPI00083877B0|nr:cytochrome P450 [Piscicoccus intestinalis]
MTTSQSTATAPGPAPKPVVGTLYAIDPEAPVQSNMKLAQQYGEIIKHQFPGRPPVYFVSSQRLVDELCDESRFDKRVHTPLENIRAFAGDGLFTAYTPEENWGKAHRILMPAFSPVALKGMFDGMVDIAEQLMLKWERLGPEADIDVTHDFTRLTLDTIAVCSFSYRFNSFYSSSMHPFVDSMVDALQESGDRGRRLPLQNRLMLLTQRRYDEDIRLMHEVADKIIAHRKEHPLPDGRSDILDTMLGATDPQTGETLSDENVRYQMVTFLIAGHETTSGLLSFTLYELLKNPEVMRAAREHVDEVLGDRYPTYADLSKLGYLDQILRETLRLWPTAPAFGLYPYEPTTIGGREGGPAYPLNPDESALVLTPSLHRDPAVWDDPERFDPDRFSFERAKTIPANAWKPFGNGQRSCIGRGFALQEAQLVLALMLQRFDLDWADPGYELKVKETLTLKPEGFFARFSVRSDRSVQGPARGTDSEPVSDEVPAVESHGTPVRILFGSNAGTSESFANQVSRQATRLGYSPSVAPLDEGVDALPSEGALVVVTASYEGQPPDNAKQFVPWLEAVPDGALDGVRYAVFGCGNTDWARTYQRIPTLVDEQLERAGAARLLERGEANARGDFFGDFEEWHERLWPAIGSALGVAASPDVDATPQLSVDIIGPGREQLLRASDLELGQVVVNRELADLSKPGARSKRHLEIALPTGQTYRTGDYLAVLPLNPVTVIDRALARFDLAYDTRLQISGAATQLPVDAPVLAGELFGSYVELSRPAGRRQVEQLAAACPCPPEKAQLLALADESTYESEVLGKRLSVLDLLERFASVSLPLATFLGMLTPLSPRQYSISSSPRWSADHATLTVAHLSAPALAGDGTYEGVASTFLAHSRPGTRIPVTVRESNVDFAPPADLSTPMVMVCAGTGLAPFRGFIQDRALRAQADGVTPAPALLFFGCDGPDIDYLYRDELQEWSRQGVVDVRPAFSAEPEDGPDGPMRFVQDRLWADRADVADLVRAGAQFYVCGEGQRMAPAVHETCVRMYAQAAGVSAEQALEWVESMEREHGRYVSDVFA